MNAEIKDSIELMRLNSKEVKNITDTKDAMKSIEKDPIFIKLLNMTIRKYEDEGLDPETITASEIIELDFDYFSSTYGVKCFLVKHGDKYISLFR